MDNNLENRPPGRWVRGGGKGLLGPLAASWGGLAVALFALSLVPGLPYNVVELFSRWPRMLAAALLALAWVLVFVPPVLVGAWLIRRQVGVLYLLLVQLVQGVVVYFGLRLAVPLESIHDLVGSPVLGWPAELERLVRFLALFCWYGVMSTGAAAFWAGFRDYHFAPMRRWVFVVLISVPVCYWGVVVQAATDNLTELLNTGPGGGYGLFLSAWMFLLAFSGSALSARMAGYMNRWGAVVLLLLLSMGGGLLLAQLALEPQVRKYGRVFSALSFMLSQDREHYVVGQALVARYFIAHLGLVFLLAVAQLPAWWGLARQRRYGLPAISAAPVQYRRTRGATRAREPRVAAGTLDGSMPIFDRMDADVPRKPSPDRRLWLAVALAYLVFVVYGSLVPLEFRPVPWDKAVKGFLHMGYRHLGIGSRADWVANILLFIPLVFFWSGVVCWGRRGRCMGRPLVVLMLAVMLSLGIEFTQQFFPPRTVSVNDLVAEAIGGAIGLLLWWWRGQQTLRWLSGIRWIRSRKGLAEYTLLIYLGGLFLYGVLPLDLTISPVEIYHKWKSGRVNLVPFGFQLGSTVEWAYGLFTDVMLWVPVGYLLMRVYGQNRFQAWTVTVALALLLESMQFFVYSRVTDITDVITAGIGAALGVWWGGGTVVSLENRTRSLCSCPYRAAGLVAALGGWFVLLLVIFWYPYDFRWDVGFLREQAWGITRLPFRAYYYGTEFRAVTELLHKVLFFMPFGIGLALLRRGSGTSSLVMGGVAWLLVVAAPLVVELGQVALPGKLPDSTDLLLAYFGIVLGHLAARRWLSVEDANQEGKTSGAVGR